IQAAVDTNLDSNKITVSGLTTIDTNGKSVAALAPLGGTGGFTVNGAGSLKTSDSATTGFGGGGSLGSLSLAVSTGATIQADRTGSDTWSGVISGGGALVKSN